MVEKEIILFIIILLYNFQNQKKQSKLSLDGKFVNAVTFYGPSTVSLNFGPLLLNKNVNLPSVCNFPD